MKELESEGNLSVRRQAVETNNGSGAGNDLLRFNNGVGGQMNCQDGNCVYLKAGVVENVQTGNMHETKSDSGTASTK